MEFRDLLGLIAKEHDRDAFIQIGRALHDVEVDRTNRAGSAATDAERRALLDELRHRLRVHLRAVRRPFPSDEELEQMVTRYFTDRG